MGAQVNESSRRDSRSLQPGDERARLDRGHARTDVRRQWGGNAALFERRKGESDPRGGNPQARLRPETGRRTPARKPVAPGRHDRRRCRGSTPVCRKTEYARTREAPAGRSVAAAWRDWRSREEQNRPAAPLRRARDGNFTPAAGANRCGTLRQPPTVAKNSKNSKIVVDSRKAPRLYTPHQRRRRRCWRRRSSLLSFAKSWSKFKRAA